jgi:homoserine/homoserine lactone efflux protein
VARDPGLARAGGRPDQGRSPASLGPGNFRPGFLVSLTNPKTLLFYGAFFPQFVAPGADLGPQLALLSITFLAVAAALDGCWALAADRLRGALALRGTLRNRLTGGFYFAAAAGLASARRSG